MIMIEKKVLLTIELYCVYNENGEEKIRLRLDSSESWLHKSYNFADVAAWIYIIHIMIKTVTTSSNCGLHKCRSKICNARYVDKHLQLQANAQTMTYQLTIQFLL